MAKTILSRQGDSVDLLCWRHYGATSGKVEAVLDANPGLAALGVELPFATAVVMPDSGATGTARVAKAAPKIISLWD